MMKKKLALVLVIGALTSCETMNCHDADVGCPMTKVETKETLQYEAEDCLKKGGTPTVDGNGVPFCGGVDQIPEGAVD